MKRQVVFLPILVTLLLSLAACNGVLGSALTPTDTPTPTPLPTATATPVQAAPSAPSSETKDVDLTAQEIASRSAERMLAVQSFHFTLNVQGEPIDLGPYIESPVPILLKSVEGDVVRPDRFQAHIMVSSMGFGVGIDLVRVGNRAYMTNPLNGAWEELPAGVAGQIDPSFLFDPKDGLPGLLPALELNLVGIEQVGGWPSYHLNVANMDRLEAVGWDDRSFQSLDTWIETQSYLMLQMAAVQEPGESGQATIWMITLNNFDQPVNIQLPM